MQDIHYRSDFDVELIEVAGSDQRMAEAARVSTLGSKVMALTGLMGLINFLMKNRHGSPFEHGMFTFRITAPIAVWREFMRHRIGFSYNEESGRYKILDGVFYIPGPLRALVQIGKPGAYEFVPGTDQQHRNMTADMEMAYTEVWQAYNSMLSDGIAKEVSRFVLPVGTYSTAYVTCNPRSLMAFLSLRTKRTKWTRWQRFVNWLLRKDVYPDPRFPSYPQWEISQVADQMEEHFAVHYPLTHDAFNKNGRVAP